MCRGALWILLVMGLSACSQVKLVYNHAGWLMRQKIKGYTDFNDSQQERLRQEIDLYFAHHRKKILPRYAAFLKRMDTRLLESDPTVADFKVWHGEFLQLYRETVEPAVNPTAEMMMTLNPEQLDRLERNVKRQNERNRHEWLDGDLEWRLKKRAERTIDSIEDWSGSLSRGQKEQVRALTGQLPYMTQVWFENREHRQAEFMKLVRVKSERQVLQDDLRAWLVEASRHRPPDQAQLFAKFDAATDQFLVDIWRLLNPKQQQQVHKTLQKYILDFEELSRDE